MLRSISIFFFILVSLVTASAQTKMSGTIKDDKGAVVAFANVYIKGSYDGASSNAEGIYSFSTDVTGDAILVVSFLGYETKETPVILEGKPLTVDVVIALSSTTIRTVTINAGSFEASDEKKGVILRPLDIVTTAGANGDIYGAINTLPGTTQVGEDEGLFVRGGAAYETKTIIDGMIVDKPYFSGVPDVPSRGRFSPFNFKGTVFSTGGYSAEYGQALSSALILNTQDFRPASASSLSIMPLAIGGGHMQSWDKTSIGVFASYTNLWLFDWIYGPRIDWQKPYEGFGGSLYGRQKFGEYGLLKAQTDYSYSRVSVNYPDLNDTTQTQSLSLNNSNIYVNTSYKDVLSEKWSIFSGVSYSQSIDDMDVSDLIIKQNDQLLQTKLKFTNTLNDDVKISFGGEGWKRDNVSQFGTLSGDLQNLFGSGYAETDIYITNNLVTRVGGRFEYASVIDEYNLAPRVSLAYQTGKISQASIAYGQFFQTPENEFLFREENLDFEKATHYIVNYQIMSDDQTLRVEGYWKDYDQLIVTPEDSFGNISSVNNSGYGYSRGLDIFWRDKKTFKNTDYWISYSYLDTKRLYRDYPSEATPPFAATHNLSLVAKYWIAKIRTSVSATYSLTSGRTYFNPNNETFLGDKTPTIHQFNLSGSYLFQIKGNFCVLFFSVSNPLGIDNVYTIRYSDDGTRKEEVKDQFLRTIFAGLFISFNYGK